jgi:hypothetical protein
MGILETRTLDLRNLIILSVNEGVLPAVSAGSSYIPFSLREAFGLPSVNHQESIYAYHFYRLLQRAENVTFAYNSNSEGLQSGEMSRFLIQMKYDKLLKPDYINLSFEIKTQSSIGNTVERTAEHSAELYSQFLNGSNERVLSPSALNTWLGCRMKFFYRYVNHLKEPERVSEDIDPAMLGSILHDVMKELYLSATGKILTTKDIDLLINDRQLLATLIEEVSNRVYSNASNNLIGGKELIVRDVLMKYLTRILTADKEIAPFTILSLEAPFSFRLPFLPDKPDLQILTGGKIDRVDLLNGVVRIVDYKTGSIADSLSSIGDLFADDRKKDYDGWLQTLLYCESYLSTNPGVSLRPSIYKIKKMTSGVISDRLRLKIDRKNEQVVDDYSSVREEFISGLKELISTLFSDNEPFVMTADERGKCSYCPYRALCLR